MCVCACAYTHVQLTTSQLNCTTTCPYYGGGGAIAHYHCHMQRCRYATHDVAHIAAHHADFHSTVNIPINFVCYDQRYACDVTTCAYTGVARHFHCDLCSTVSALCIPPSINVHAAQALLKVNVLDAHTRQCVPTRQKHPTVRIAGTTLVRLEYSCV